MAHVRRRPGRPRPWMVRYRDPAGRERARSFSKKVDADRFAVTVEADMLRAEWTDPRLAKTTLAEWSERWLRTKAVLKPKTLAGYESNLRAHVLPTFGDLELRHIDRMSVEEWVADLQASGLGSSGVRQARQVLYSMTKLAVEAGYLLTNPVAGVKTARRPDPEMLFLSAREVERLADAIRTPYGVLVHLLAYGGLRWGEAAALRRKRCDLLRSRIEVAESVSEVRGSLHFGTTKTHLRRVVVLPGFLRDLIAEHLSNSVSEDPNALVFTSPVGAPLRNSNFRRQAWSAAVFEAGLPAELRIHDLRTYMCRPPHRSGCPPQSDSGPSRSLVDHRNNGPLWPSVPFRHGVSRHGP